MTYIVGLVIGAVLGLTGAGGSVFAVPLLMALLSMSAQQAMGISLGAVAISALFGVFTKLRSGHIQWLPALAFLFVGSIFSPLGTWLNRQTNETALLIGFSILVVLVALKLWKQASTHPEQTHHVRSGSSSADENKEAICIINQGKPFKVGPRCMIGICLSAMATGILSGLFGVGGGFMIVPTLIFLTSISMQQAVATSLVVISAVSGSGFISYLMLGDPLEMAILVQVALGGLTGMTIGIFASQYIAGPKLQKIFSVLMLMIAIVTVASILKS